MYNRGFKYIFFSQQAVATDQAKVFAEWIANLPPEQRPKTAAYPSLDDPFAGPVVEGAEKILSAAGINAKLPPGHILTLREGAMPAPKSWFRAHNSRMAST